MYENLENIGELLKSLDGNGQTEMDMVGFIENAGCGHMSYKTRGEGAY